MNNMNENKNTEELINSDSKEILDLLRKEWIGSSRESREAKRQFLSGILNYKLSKTTESLSKKILWLNIILVVLTIILVIDPAIKFLIKIYEFFVK